MNPSKRVKLTCDEQLDKDIRIDELELPPPDFAYDDQWMIGVWGHWEYSGGEWSWVRPTGERCYLLNW